MQDSSLHNFAKRIISIDFEFDKKNDNLYCAGVYIPAEDHIQEWKINKNNETTQLEKFDTLCSKYEIILGHNILDHDLKLLGQFYPHLRLLNKPVIDTLLLSPLAFPKHPYHRLIKDYKLVKSAKNHPGEDSKLAWILFRDEIENFLNKTDMPDEIFEAYAQWFTENDNKGGFQRFFEFIANLRALSLSTDERDVTQLKKELDGKCCLTHFDGVFLSDNINPYAKAFVLSWNFGADEYSVLSKWVRSQFKQVPGSLERLRNDDCGKAECKYCQSTFNINSNLEKYFGLPSLREKQIEIVERMMQDENLIAILPTGGGKSLCFQLPALIKADRRKYLTIVISPLQALMKDQVDNLVKKGIINAGAIYSGISQLERKEILEEIEKGKIDIVFVAPEQLRNKNFISKISQREIGSWIIDEAHCVSKWGHDFRPDYLYIPKIISRLSGDEKTNIPQIACFTATAKVDVIKDIKEVFESRLGISMGLKNEGHKRLKLHYSTEEVVDKKGKDAKLIEIISEEPGDIIIYCATKKKTETVAKLINNSPGLIEAGKKAAHFHSDVDSRVKASIQDQFINDDKDLNIIVATNAFGMGVDKPNVRLVLHYDIPGSLENYLQEAGRAGRDQNDARCILLYSPGDIDLQFDMKTFNRITEKDANEIWRGLKKIDTKTGGKKDVSVTAGQILMEEDVKTNFEIGDSSTENKVRTALSVLEESGILRREENQYWPYQLSKIEYTLEEVQKELAKWDLPAARKAQFETIYHELLQSDPDDLVNIDRLAYITGIGIKGVPIILMELNSRGIITITTNVVVYLTKGRRGDSRNKLQMLLDQQDRLFELMVETSKQWDKDETFPFKVRESTALMQNTWDKIQKNEVTELLKNLRRMNIIDMRRRKKDLFRVRIKKDYTETKEIIKELRIASTLIINYIFQVLDSGTSQAIPESDTQEGQLLPEPSGPVSGKDIRAEFTMEGLEKYLKTHFAHLSLEDRVKLINRTLLFLDKNDILKFGRGLAVLKTAMRIHLTADTALRKVKIENLLAYYKEQIFQVHVLEEYAERSLKELMHALDFVADYFTLSRAKFETKYFPGRTTEELERPTSKADYHKIVEQLNNSIQEKIVKSKIDSMLVIAGPGSGKTRAIVHRAAYLLKVERIKSSAILIVAFNREAVNEIKNRLRELAGGRLASRVDIYTYHGIAMRLAGKMFTPSIKPELNDSGHDENGNDENSDYFDKILRESVQVLDRADDEDHSDWEERRYKLLRGYSHILVDEYQDIDQWSYRLISAIAGRSLEEMKLKIMAVGDDDQNIYSWKGSNVEYIKKFKEEYKSETVYLVENYRSTKAIIASSNKLISHNGDRLKKTVDTEVRINDQRQDSPVGGMWESLDSSGDKGRVTVLDIDERNLQAGAILTEIKRRMNQDPYLQFSDIAILTRGHADVDYIIEAFRTVKEPVPTRKPSPGNIPFPIYREVAIINGLLRDMSNDIKYAKDIEKVIENELRMKSDETWQYRVLLRLIDDFGNFYGGSVITVDEWEQYLWDYAATQKGQIPEIDAVLATTIYQAKGKEFKHVFLLDPGAVGRSSDSGKTMEDERRLYYVGLTRARETCTILKVKNSATPFADEVLKADCFAKRRDGQADPQFLSIKDKLPEAIEVIQMGLRDIWAASFAREQSTYYERDKVQQLLAEIPVDTPLEIIRSEYRPNDGSLHTVEIHHDGLWLGNLSMNTASKYQEPGSIKAQVGAVIQCKKDEDDDNPTLETYFAVLPRVIKIRWS